MNDQLIQDLINRYVDVSFAVTKKAENLIKESIGDTITNDQHYTLRYIHKAGTCTSTELSEVFDVKKSAITAIINRLTEKELIKRTRDEKDRRVIYLTLSDKGKDLFEKTEEKIHKLVESIITSFDEREIVSFIETYEKLNTQLDTIKDCKMED